MHLRRRNDGWTSGGTSRYSQGNGGQRAGNRGLDIPQKMDRFHDSLFCGEGCLLLLLPQQHAPFERVPGIQGVRRGHGAQTVVRGFI